MVSALVCRDLLGRSSSLEHGSGRLPDQLPGFAVPALWIYSGKSTGLPVLSYYFD